MKWQMWVVMLGIFMGSQAEAGPLARIEMATSQGNARTLVKLMKHRVSSIRQRAARGLRSVPARVGRERATETLLGCLRDPHERTYVRSECALTLGQWKVKAASPLIIEAMENVDTEARYWMAIALHNFDDTDARAVLEGLQDDQDVFLSTIAREWASDRERQERSE